MLVAIGAKYNFFELKINFPAKKKKNIPKDKREETSLRTVNDFTQQYNK